MCRRHWFMVPKVLRDEVWATYRTGQEITKDPSEEYLDAMLAAVNAVDAKELEALANAEESLRPVGGPLEDQEEKDG